MIRLHFLPHFFKYIAIVLYFITSLPVAIPAFVRGYNAGYEKSDLGGAEQYEDFFPAFFYSNSFQVLPYLAILLYLFAKDRVTDELMIRMRLESIYLVFFGTILFFIGRLLFDINLQISASYLVEAQMIFVILINAIRKRTIAAS